MLLTTLVGCASAPDDSAAGTEAHLRWYTATIDCPASSTYAEWTPPDGLVFVQVQSLGWKQHEYGDGDEVPYVQVNPTALAWPVGEPMRLGPCEQDPSLVAGTPRFLVTWAIE